MILRKLSSRSLEFPGGLDFSPFIVSSLCFFRFSNPVFFHSALFSLWISNSGMLSTTVKPLYSVFFIKPHVLFFLLFGFFFLLFSGFLF